MKKKMLSIALAGVLAFGAVACGGGDAETGASEGTTTATEATS